MAEEVVIAISRQLGSGGAYLGQRVAARLGLRYLDRGILRQAAEELHEQEGYLAAREERLTSFWEKLLRQFAAGVMHGSPADEAGLKPDDEVISIDGRPILSYTPEEMDAVVRAAQRKPSRHDGLPLMPMQNTNQRIVALDAARGYCLVIMTLDHLPDHVFSRFSNAQFGPFGFFTAASLFVFLSGIVSARSYGRTCEQAGWGATWRRVGRRMLQLYAANTAVLLLLLAGAVLFGDLTWVWRLAGPAQGYGGLCVVAGVIGTPWWISERWRAHHPVTIRSHRARLVDLERPRRRGGGPSGRVGHESRAATQRELVRGGRVLVGVQGVPAVALEVDALRRIEQECQQLAVDDPDAHRRHGVDDEAFAVIDKLRKVLFGRG